MSKHSNFFGGCIFACAALLSGCAASQPEPQVTVIAIPGVGVFPESLTSTSAGDIIIGSAGSGAIYRAAPGDAAARVWIAPQSSGLVSVLGVFADEAGRRLFVCSRPARGASGSEADAASALRVFDLASGAAMARYAMPGGAGDVCNDIAMRDGFAFVAETRTGRIYRLSPGAQALELWAEDARFAGADGLAFDRDGGLVFNTVTTNRLFKIAFGADGSAGAVTELTPTRPLSRPDGLRALEGGVFIMAEAGSGVTRFTIEGDAARVEPLGGVAGTTAVTYARGRVWAVDAKLAHRSDYAYPGPFEVYSLPLE